MSLPILTPTSQLSAVVLPVTGTADNVNDGCPFKVYSDPASELYSTQFITGAVEQVNYTYRRLGGDVLDLEITADSVYSSYEEAVLEYGYLINMHQARNAMHSALGSPTASFDHDGQIESGSALSGTNHALDFPRFSFSYSKTVMEGTSDLATISPNFPVYSASVDLTLGQQDYDLQAAVSASSDEGGVPYAGKVGNQRIHVTRVFYKTRAAMWRFMGMYSGINVVGNLHNYGQWSDSSTFEMVPVWQHMLQATAFEDSLKTRYSDYSYEIKNNKLRIFPIPRFSSPIKLWFEFYLPSERSDPFNDPSMSDSISGSITETERNGVNNMNTLPFANLPYKNINSIGKMWIRRYALALSMLTLGYVRSKYDRIPIPNDNVTLNGVDLINRAKEEMATLKEELKTNLDELTYDKLTGREAEIARNTKEVNQSIPSLIYVG